MDRNSHFCRKRLHLLSHSRESPSSFALASLVTTSGAGVCGLLTAHQLAGSCLPPPRHTTIPTISLAFPVIGFEDQVSRMWTFPGLSYAILTHSWPRAGVFVSRVVEVEKLSSTSVFRWPYYVKPPSPSTPAPDLISDWAKHKLARTFFAFLCLLQQWPSLLDLSS